MKKQIEELMALGCDVKDAFSRIGEDENFYLECAFEALQDQSFIKLGEYLEQKDGQNAFLHAHNLKGVLLNLSFTSLLEDIVPIVELLRKNSFVGTKKHYEQLMKKREALLQVFTH